MLPADRDSAALVTTATSQPALTTGFVMLGLASLLDLSTGRRAWGADRVLAVSGAAAAGWYLKKATGSRAFEPAGG